MTAPVLFIREPLSQRSRIEMRLDEALMLATFDLKPSIVFEGAGIACLQKSNIARYDWLRRILAWEEYGIDALLVSTETLVQQNIETSSCLRGVTSIKKDKLEERLFQPTQESSLPHAIMATSAFTLDDWFNRVKPTVAGLFLQGEAVSMQQDLNDHITTSVGAIYMRRESISAGQKIPAPITALNDNEWAKQLASHEVLTW